MTWVHTSTATLCGPPLTPFAHVNQFMGGCHPPPRFSLPQPWQWLCEACPKTNNASSQTRPSLRKEGRQGEGGVAVNTHPTAEPMPLPESPVCGCVLCCCCSWLHLHLLQHSEQTCNAAPRYTPPLRPCCRSTIATAGMLLPPLTPTRTHTEKQLQCSNPAQSLLLQTPTLAPHTNTHAYLLTHNQFCCPHVCQWWVCCCATHCCCLYTSQTHALVVLGECCCNIHNTRDIAQ